MKSSSCTCSFPTCPVRRGAPSADFSASIWSPGASQKVDFQLNPRDLSMVTDLGDIIVAQGKYTLSIGSGQPGTGVPSVNGNFEVKGQIILPE